MTNDEELPRIEDEQSSRDPLERSARRFLISGHVQGVGLRYFARKRARALELSGWVRNLPEGDVELQVEGLTDAVEAFLTALGSGPPGAEIEAIEVIETDLTGAERFEVRE